MPNPSELERKHCRIRGDGRTRFIDLLTSADRKKFPMSSGLVDYAPDALAAISHISYVGNEKHNKELHAEGKLRHSRHLSTDHADCVMRHHSTREDVDPAFADDLIAEVFHKAEEAWRAIMQLQVAMEEIYNLPLPLNAYDPRHIDDANDYSLHPGA